MINEDGVPTVYGPTKQFMVDGQVVDTSGELTERQYLHLFIQRPGMYIGRVTLRGVTGFLEGYDFAARRVGGAGLDGFTEWLDMNHLPGHRNIAWSAIIQQIALPEWDFHTDLTPEQEERTLEVLFDLLDRFLAERETTA